MQRRRSHVARRVAVIALILCAAAPAAAATSQSAHLEVGLVPERLGRGTTIEFGFHITANGGGVPSPVTRMELRYPKNLGIITSGLGLASCTQTVLESLGVEGCPSRSVMGYGTAVAEVQVGPQIIRELASSAIFMAPLAEGAITLQFFINGETPLSAQLIFPGQLLAASTPYGGNLTITVPPLESFPAGPDVSLVGLRSTIGPLGITYYQRLHGRLVAYQPNGITLPSTCPQHGFPFAISFAFADGTRTTSRTSVPCPKANRR
jgi:hypothetical protein